MLPSLNSPANHLNTCLTLSKSLSLRHSNHSCVIYSCPFGEQKECNLANPQPIRRQNQSDRPRCWEIFAWLWTCVLAGTGSDVSLNSVGNPHGFFPAFHMGFRHPRVPKPQVLLLSAWQRVTLEECLEKKLGQMAMQDGYGCQGSALEQESAAFSASVILDSLNCVENVARAFSHIMSPNPEMGGVTMPVWFASGEGSTPAMPPGPRLKHSAARWLRMFALSFILLSASPPHLSHQAELRIFLCRQMLNPMGSSSGFHQESPAE